MGQDQHPAGPRRFDEAERGDGLAGAGGVLEPEAAIGAGVIGGAIDDVLVELTLRIAPVLRLDVLGLGLVELGGLFFLLFVLIAPDVVNVTQGGRTLAVDQLIAVERAVAIERVVVVALVLADRGRSPVAVAVAIALRLGEERRQRAGQGVDLMGGEHRAVDEVRLLLGEQSLQPEQQRVRPPPFERRDLQARVGFGQRGVERPPPGRAGCKCLLSCFALVDKALTRQLLSPRDRGRTRERGGITHGRFKGVFAKVSRRSLRVRLRR